ncbi:hypothetical protein BH11MYX2_BH11MYX2_38850 [soil metagenome]
MTVDLDLVDERGLVQVDDGPRIPTRSPRDADSRLLGVTRGWVRAYKSVLLSRRVLLVLPLMLWNVPGVLAGG